jgi:hypothetical protein
VLPQPAAVVMEVRKVPVSMSVTPSHHRTLHLSAVYFVGTSTASGLHGLFAGPQFAPTCKVSVNITIFKLQQIVQEKIYFIYFLLSLPDEK